MPRYPAEPGSAVGFWVVMTLFPGDRQVYTLASPEWLVTMVPARIGPYRIERLLGEGGMGAVYEGVHDNTARRVAIKVLHAEYARDATMTTRFFNEARAVRNPPPLLPLLLLLPRRCPARPRHRLRLCRQRPRLRRRCRSIKRGGSGATLPKGARLRSSVPELPTA